MSGILEAIDAKLDKILEQMEGEKPAPAEKPKTTTTKKTTATRKRSSGKASVDLNAVKDQARAVLKTEGGKEKLIELLEEFDVEKVVELDEGDYAEFVAKCTKVTSSDDDDEFDI